MKRIATLLAGLAGLVLFSGLRPPGAPLTCSLRALRTSYRLEEIPVLEVRLFNNTGREICLIGSLDGSDLKWRMPHCYFSIEKPIPDTVHLARCGNMDGLRKSDFVAVQPGGFFNPYPGGADKAFYGDYQLMNGENFGNPGIYRLRFHYSTASDNIDDYLGDGRWNKDAEEELELKKLLAKVPKTEIESNEVELRFEP